MVHFMQETAGGVETINVYVVLAKGLQDNENLGYQKVGPCQGL
jgi:hypothetical protein